MKIRTRLATPSLMGVMSAVVFAGWFLVGFAVFLVYTVCIGNILFGLLSWFVTLLLIGIPCGLLVVEMPTKITFWLIKQWGHDGAELLLTRTILQKLREDAGCYLRLAEKYGLSLRFHQPWCIPDLFQRVLVKLGITPSVDLVAQAINEGFRLGIQQMVVHSDYIQYVEAQYLNRCLVEIVDYSLIPAECRVVLDTCYTVARGPELFSADNYLAIWDEVLRRYKKRISGFHVYDVKFGAPKFVRKNRWPGTGSLPLAAALAQIKDFYSGNDEIVEIVLELNPIHTMWLVIKSFGRFWPTKETFLKQMGL